MMRARPFVVGCLIVPAALLLLAGGLVLAVLLTPAPESEPVEQTHRVEIARPAGASDDMPTRIRLELETGVFRVEAGDSSAIEVEAAYDQATHRLDLLDQDGVQVVRFGPSIGLFQTLARAREGHAQDEARVVVRLPRGVPIELSAEVSKGISRLQPDGLDLRSLELDVSMGEHRVELDEPQQTPWRHLKLKVRMGEARFDGLGHAAPAELEVDAALGQTRLNLDTPLPRACRAQLKLRMGEVAVYTPDDQDVYVLQPAVTAGELKEYRQLRPLGDAELEPEGAALTLGVDLAFGEVSLH